MNVENDVNLKKNTVKIYANKNFNMQLFKLNIKRKNFFIMFF